MKEIWFCGLTQNSRENGMDHLLLRESGWAMTQREGFLHTYQLVHALPSAWRRASTKRKFPFWVHVLGEQLALVTRLNVYYTLMYHMDSREDGPCP